MVSLVYSRRKEMGIEQVRKFLKYTELTKVSTDVPFRKVEPNSVYIYRVFTETSHKYWRHDGYKWTNLRGISFPKVNPKIRRISFQLTIGKEKVDLFRHEWQPFADEIAPPNNWKTPYVIVHYTGSYDLENYKGRPHGNRKPTPEKNAARLLRELTGEVTPEKPKSTAVNQTARKRTGGYYGKTSAIITAPVNKSSKETPETAVGGKNTEDPSLNSAGIHKDGLDVNLVLLNQIPIPTPQSSPHPEPSNKSASKSPNPVQNAAPFESSHPSVRQNLYQKLENSRTPAQAFREVTREGLLSQDAFNSSLLPRNKKQVYNTQQKIKRENKHDDIYEVYRFGRENPEVIVKLEMLPWLITIQMNPDLNKHISSLYQIYNPVVFHYDTTFGIGTFYTSILSMRHPLFKNEPVVTVAVMFHEKTNGLVHETFFKSVIDKLDINTDRTIFVTDREKGIINAIKTCLPNVKNVFCWNHIRRNAGDWVQRNLSAKDAGGYKMDVLTLLFSESYEQYQEKLDTFKSTWDEKFTKYYETYLSESILESYRLVLEERGLFSELSGMTNNPAESANASFKKITDLKNATLFQAVSGWFFYQVDGLVEILRGLESNGDFSLKGSVPNGIYKPVKIRDAVNSDVISSLIFEGKVPVGLQSNYIYKSVSLHEATTLRGLARMYIEKDQVILLPKQKVFVVTGLLEKTFIVDLNTGSCSCPRPTICEHRIAASMASGTDKTRKWKRCQPHIGSLYRKTVKKATGTKRGQGRRLRVLLPKPTTNQITSVVTKRHSGSLSSPFIPSKNLQLTESTKALNVIDFNKKPALGLQTTTQPKLVMLKSQPSLPILTTNSANESFLCFPTGNISLLEIKSVQNNLQKGESRTLGRLMKIEDTEEETFNWMVDSVIDGFLLKITDLRNKGDISITAQETMNIFRGGETSSLFSLESSLEDYHEWSSVNQVLIPFNKEENHWILIILRVKLKTILVLDPLGDSILPMHFTKRLRSIFNPKFGYRKNEVWEIVYPERSLSIGRKAIQCGPFICYYAEASVMDLGLNDMPCVEDYRNHIINTLIGGCMPKISKNLHAKNEFDPKKTCSFCKQNVQSLKHIEVRGRGVNVCS